MSQRINVEHDREPGQASLLRAKSWTRITARCRTTKSDTCACKYYPHDIYPVSKKKSSIAKICMNWTRFTGNLPCSIISCGIIHDNACKSVLPLPHRPSSIPLRLNCRLRETTSNPRLHSESQQLSESSHRHLRHISIRARRAIPVECRPVPSGSEPEIALLVHVPSRD